MKNILSELEERLEAAKREEKQLLDRLKTIQEHRQALEHVIDFDKRFHNARERPRAASGGVVLERVDKKPQKLGEFVLGLLADGAVWHLNEMTDKAVANGALPREGSPGRKVHGALLSLMHRSKVENLGKGMWRRKTPPSFQAKMDLKHDGGPRE